MNYKLMKKEHLKELDSYGFQYEHNSGARIVYIKNNDKNKVFSITFQTPSENDCGTAHILEHSVLCGSKKYPVKDPFNELSKGSLYTFLNAMTYKEKTIYPIASCNEADFYNLMDVYLDAVFNPLIKERKEIFLQEGWHYNLSKEGSVIGYNGIVYNEMNGVYSDPLEILEYNLYRQLFGESPLGFDSGGKPDEIVNLSFLGLIDFYEKNYRPENCFIYIYGDIDIEKCLNFIDKNYLSTFANCKARENKVKIIGNGKTSYYKGKFPCNSKKQEGKKYLSCAYAWGDLNLDNKSILAIRLLKRYLFDMPSSPIKRMLIDNGFAEDVIANFDTSINTPVFVITIKNSEKTLEEFEIYLKEIFMDILKTGTDIKLMKACLNKYEFIVKEENYGSRPRGLALNLQIITDWVYNNAPFEKLSKLKYIEELKENMDIFTDIIDKCFMKSNWRAYVSLEGEEKDETPCFIEENNIDIEKILEENKKMESFQKMEDTKEDLEKIPIIAIKDIDSHLERTTLEEKEIFGQKVFHCILETNDIAYIDIIFDTSSIEHEKLPFIGLLCYLLNKVDAKKFNLNDLTAEINEYLGGFQFYFKVFTMEDSQYKPTVILNAKAVSGNCFKIFELAEEVCKNSIFDDVNKLEKLVKELYVKLENSLLNEGQSYAISRVTSYMFESGDYGQQVFGLEFYNFVKNLKENFHMHKDVIAKELKTMAKNIFCQDNISFGITCSEECYSKFEENMENFVRQMPKIKPVKKDYPFFDASKSEGVITASNVQYVVKGWKCKDFVDDNHGKMEVLTNILDGNYLLQKIRLEGGAYGCYSRYDRRGALYFFSYRDPNLENTLKIYDKFLEFLENFDIDEREIEKYIIGTINKHLRPMHVSLKGHLQISYKICQIEYEDLVKQREDILSFNIEDFKNLVRELKPILAQEYICVVGNKAVLNSASHIFQDIK